ncbi:hypothetical protein TGP89_310090 [Toxoplasma gondii p89]|uniref:Uncharacterized protein n=4 Tax=Toxoplasma gondii TaxID=5811 RepID=A0A086K8Q3_TOXGO|nr:hypothetical protein TGP89_310090 [Toxoplasma gondii p89]
MAADAAEIGAQQGSRKREDRRRNAEEWASGRGRRAPSSRKPPRETRRRTPQSLGRRKRRALGVRCTDSRDVDSARDWRPRETCARVPLCPEELSRCRRSEAAPALQSPRLVQIFSFGTPSATNRREFLAPASRPRARDCRAVLAAHAAIDLQHAAAPSTRSPRRGRETKLFSLHLQRGVRVYVQLKTERHLQAAAVWGELGGSREAVGASTRLCMLLGVCLCRESPFWKCTGVLFRILGPGLEVCTFRSVSGDTSPTQLLALKRTSVDAARWPRNCRSRMKKWRAGRLRSFASLKFGREAANVKVKVSASEEKSPK